MSALVTRVGNVIARSRDLKRQSDLRNIAAAIQMYAAEHGKIPGIETLPHQDYIEQKTREGKKFIAAADISNLS